MPSSEIPRLRFAHFPTPYHEAPRLAAEAGLSALWIKREDCSGAALGGNKLRQIEYILGAARAAGADTLVTTAASQSNFCRALAGSCAENGFGCSLLLRASGGREPVGNLLLMQLFGAEISFTEATDPWHPAIHDELAAIAARLRARGRTPFIVHLPGETAPLAAAAWALAAEELAEDFTRAGKVPDIMGVACGSALTLAGLAVGFARLKIAIELLGVSVQQPAERLRPWVEEVVGRTTRLLDWHVPDAMQRVRITDDHIAPGYAMANPAGLAAMQLAAVTAGLVLDPVYTGKAFAGLLAAVRPGGTACFLHSGGAPALFSHTRAVAASL